MRALSFQNNRANCLNASLLGRTIDHQALLKQFEHLNHMNPDTFEVEDLDHLIKSVLAVMERNGPAA